MSGECKATYKREIWINLIEDECGVTKLKFFESKQKAEEYFLRDDVCLVKKLTISSDSEIHIMEVDE